MSFRPTRLASLGTLPLRGRDGVCWASEHSPGCDALGRRRTMARPMEKKGAGAQLEAPRIIRMHPDDNVAIVVNDFGLPAGTQLPSGPRLREHVPQGHKV